MGNKSIHPANRSVSARTLAFGTSSLRSIAVSALVVAAVAVPRSVLAQSAPASPPERDIVVTGSRIQHDGFKAPTPVTVIGSEEIEKRGITNVGDLLNETPAFRASQQPAANTSTATGAGFTFADLRGLGSPRTLVLVDGRRHVPSAATGQVDLNLIPTILIDRTEVVTGGASAAWGSDAVAGVVNLVLKHDLEGVNADVSGGVSRFGDNREFRAALAAGTHFAGDRGRVVAGFEYVDNTGVGDSTQRSWSRQDYGIATNPTPGVNGLPARIIGPNFYQSQLAAGGIILNSNANGPLKGTTFNPDGTPVPFQFGQVFGTGMFGPGTTGLTQQIGVVWKVPVKRYTGLINVDYQFSDHLSGFAQFGYADSKSTNFNGYPRDASLTVKVDNAFLPSSVRQTMIANNLSQITVGRYDLELPVVQPTAESKTLRIVGGLKGDVGGGWTWNTYYQYGRNNYRVDIRNNRVNANWFAAIDAVNVNGTIVCRNPNLVTSGVQAATGCVPFNIFGQGAASPAAIAYVTANGYGDTVVQQHVAALNIAGEPFSLWAGPVSLAFGAEYRNEKAVTTSDALSTALAFNIGNPRPISGSYNVKDVYAELAVPLIKDASFTKSLEFNAAGRHSDYSLSGAVDTWKLGLTWEPVDGLRFRGTRSRDIRAPNIAELFSLGTFSRPVVVNRTTGIGTNIPVNTGIGNQNLRPERADTTTIGVILQPRFLPGFAASIDYYNISMKDVITTLATQTLVDRCAAGATEFCQYVIGAGTNTITLVNNANLNLNALKTRGEDVEVRYRSALDPVGLPGDLAFRLLITHVEELTTTDSVSSIDRAGQLGAVGGIPKWTWDGQLSYHVGNLTLTTGVHRISGGVYDVTLVGPEDPGYNVSATNSINTNRVRGATYVRLGVQYDVVKSDGRTVQLYAVANNLFNRDPSPSPTGATVMNGQFFDPVGQTFTAGIRVKM